MKRFWPYWALPALHFNIVLDAAFAVHYSNGINVRGFRGDFGFWMDIGNFSIAVFEFTRWFFPMAMLLILLKTKEKKTAGICFIATGSLMPFFTWPVYSGLIHFWERSWING